MKHLVPALAVLFLVSACSTYKGPHNVDITVTGQDYQAFSACLYPKLVKLHHPGINFGASEEEMDELVEKEILMRDITDEQTIRIWRQSAPIVIAAYGLAHYWTIDISQQEKDVVVQINHAKHFDIPVVILPIIETEMIPECTA